MKPEPPKPTIGIFVIVLLVGLLGGGLAVGSAVSLVHAPKTQEAVVTGTRTGAVRVHTGSGTGSNHRQSFTRFRLSDGTEGSAVSNGRVKVGDKILVYRSPKEAIGWRIQGPKYRTVLGVLFGLLILGVSLWGLYAWIRARRRPRRSPKESPEVARESDPEREAYEAAKREDLYGDAK